MLENQLSSFLGSIKTDADLQEKVKAARDVDSVVAIAKEANFLISSEELKSANRAGAYADAFSRLSEEDQFHNGVKALQRIRILITLEDM